MTTEGQHNGFAPAWGVRLAQLMAAKLTHDLAGVCGMLQGALELVGEDPAAATEALALAQDGSVDLARRLRLLRAAWGTVEEALDARQLLDLAAGLPGSTRLTLEISGLGGAALAPPAGQLALNALLLGAEALRLGGTLVLSSHTQAIELAISGRYATWPDGLMQLLGAQAAARNLAWRAIAEAGPRGLQAPLLVLLADLHGRVVQLPDGPTGVLRVAAEAVV